MLYYFLGVEIKHLRKEVYSLKAVLFVLQQLQATLWQILAGLVVIWLQKYIDDHHR